MSKPTPALAATAWDDLPLREEWVDIEDVDRGSLPEEFLALSSKTGSIVNASVRFYDAAKYQHNFINKFTGDYIHDISHVQPLPKTPEIKDE